MIEVTKIVIGEFVNMMIITQESINDGKKCTTGITEA